MVNLLYIYSNSIEFLQNDFKKYDIKNCFVLHIPDLLPYSVLQYFEELGGLKSLSQIADIFMKDSQLDKFSKNIYLQKVESDISRDGSFLSFCRMLLDLHSDDDNGGVTDLIFDLSDCSPNISPFLYYMLLNDSRSNIKAIVWNKNDLVPKEIPLFVLEPAAKKFVRLISLGYQTIPALQRAYVSKREKSPISNNQKGIISQPTVSKYLSKLKKLGIIASHFEGRKKFFTVSPSFGHLL